MHTQVTFSPTNERSTSSRSRTSAQPFLLPPDLLEEEGSEQHEYSDDDSNEADNGEVHHGSAIESLGHLLGGGGLSLKGTEEEEERGPVTGLPGEDRSTSCKRSFNATVQQWEHGFSDRRTCDAFYQLARRKRGRPI
jgi:hypothetical protein